MKPGTQIAYIPYHSQNSPVLCENITNADVEFGFVTSKGVIDNHFCRYWSKYEKGILRTIANSESTTNDCLVECISVDQSIVDELLEKIQNNREIYG